MLLHIRTLFYALMLPFAIRRRWSLQVPADVADEIMRTAVEIPDCRPWVEYLLRNRA